MEAATGQWLAILDADDAFEPQRLERIFATLSHQDGHSVLGDHWMYCISRGAELVPVRETRAYPSSENLGDFLVHKPFLVKPVFPARVRDLGVRYPAYFAWEDAVFMCRVLARDYRLRLCPEPLYLYRLRKGSLSHDLAGFHATEAVFADLLEELESALDEQGRQALEVFISKARNERYYLPLLEALRQKRYVMVVRQLLNDRACRHEFLRRLGPSILQRLRILRYPGTIGR
jgi:glycosyltransferase involved in cell wall biosynthesis